MRSPRPAAKTSAFMANSRVAEGEQSE
jgi:hypothetical protein